MKIKVVLLSFLCMFIATTNVNASSFSSFYPGGKNYVEFENFYINGDSISSIDDIRIKGDTTYTLSIPGEVNIENPYFLVESSSTTYFDDIATDIPECDYNLDYTVCTFTTDPTDEFITIDMVGESLGSLFSYYEGLGFQLEEGSSRTSYEEYVMPLIDSNDPEFSGNAAFIMAYHDNYDIEYIINTHIVAVDDIDGDISTSIVIASDEYTPNKNTVGEYLVELEASDTSGNTAYFNLTVIVKDEEMPSIQGPTELNIDVDNQYTIEEIIADNYVGVDGYEGSILVTTTVDNYSSNKMLLGNYNVTLTTSDDSGNAAIKNVVINVVDYNSPILDSSGLIAVYMSNPKDITTIIDELIITDNYDLDSDIITTVLVDGYSDLSDTIGSYTVELMMTDTSGNNSVVVLFIDVMDDVAPILSGPATYSISYTTPYNLTQIIQLLTVSDNLDNLTSDDIVITLNTYSDRNTDIGIFEVEFEVVDSSSNISTHALEIHVIDDQAPIIYIDNYLVTLSSNVSFTPEDALNILVNNHELPNKDYEIVVLNDEYSGNEEQPGTYLYSLMFTDEDGASLQKDFVVKVDEEKPSLDTSLIIRNGIIYGFAIAFFGFVVYKNKK